MKLSVLDIPRLISVNKLKECSSPKLFATGKNSRDPDGIISDDIFGMSRQDRKSTFAYIDLKLHYIQPHVYHHILSRMCSEAIAAVNGVKRFRIENGWFVEDAENGWTGIVELYNHWDQLDWSRSRSENADALKFLKLSSRDEVFMDRWVISPPGYRDVMPGTAGDRSDKIPEVNSMYTQLIRLCDSQSEGGTFLGRINTLQVKTQTKVQELLVKIYLHYGNLISGKHGLVRKYLMGKSITYGTRAVISAPNYNHETIHDSMIDIEHAAIPISQCCATFKPFISAWVTNFFTREIISNPTLITFINDKGENLVGQIKDPEVQFSDQAVENMIYNFVRNPDSRFDLVTVDVTVPSRKRPIRAGLVLHGKKFVQGNRTVSLDRPLTITDILYLACVDTCEDKRYVMISRYPVGTDKNIFFNKVRVQSTKQHIRLLFNGKEYRFYPDINLKLDPDRIGVEFVDTCVYSNSLLKGMGADYDGDQVSLRGLWSDEANAEAERIMSRKVTALTITGGMIRFVEREVINAYYELTKIGNTKSKHVTPEDTERYLRLEPDGFTRSVIVEMLADVADITAGRSAAVRRSRYNSWDIIELPANYFYPGQPARSITIGRFLFNKYVLQGAGISAETKIVDAVINSKQLSVIDNQIGDFLLNDVITRQQFNTYVNRRDNLGYWLNGILAHTISLNMAKPLKQIERKKAELLKKYAAEIEAKDIEVMSRIENELRDYAREILKDDPGMDLYLSGDLNFDNNYKNNSILKGPVKNNITGEYDFIDTSYMDGLKAKDLPAHANSIVAGAFPSAIQTAPAGYLGKQLLSLLQMAEADEPGTDCHSLNPIPITVTKANANELIYSYFVDDGGQLKLLEPSNVQSYVGQTLRFRSPMSCTTHKFCSKCMGELIYKLGVRQVGLFAVQLSDANLNLALKAKHDQTVSGIYLDPDKIIVDL